MTVPSDNPIFDKKDDLLGRHQVAKSFALHSLAQDASQGAVVGVLGAWGSGKTSFVNLARPYLESGSSAVIDFNPWMFSGAEQLVSSFFIEVSAQLQLKDHLREVGEELGDYGEAFSGMGWLPLIGPWIERLRGIAKLLDKLWQRRKKGVAEARKRVIEVLSQLDKPIVVVLDDIDRLETGEIRDIFKLVRLTASFPNIIYVLAFDRGRVEKALQQDGVPGRDYLEKILMIAFDLPAIPQPVLVKQTTTSIENALSDIDEPGPFDEQAWQDLFVEIIRPLIRNMRDVRRFVASLHGTVLALEGKVALGDVMSLEAIRVFLPDVFAVLHESVEALTTPALMSDGSRDYKSERLKTQIDKLMESSGERSETVESMVKRLFPAAERHLGGKNYSHDWQKTWLRDRRVAHKDVLAFYLERVVGEGLRSLLEAEHALALLENPRELDGYLRSLEYDRLKNVLWKLQDIEGDFQQAHVVNGVVVLLNLLPEIIPDRPLDYFEPDDHKLVTIAVFRLLASLDDSVLITLAAKGALPQVNCLSSKLDLITVIGHGEAAGHKLVSEVDAARFERAWRDAVRAARPEQLVIEPDVFRVLLIAKRESTENEGTIELDDCPALTSAVLKSARHEVRSQGFESRYISRSYRLHWDALVELFEGETSLRDRIDRLKEQKSEDDSDVLELADKYLEGWRPGTL